MARAKKRVLTLQEAAERANERGLIGDYYSMDDGELSELRNIMASTRWRMSASSAAKGWTTTQAFHKALKGRLPNRGHGGSSSAKVAAYQAWDYAHKLSEKLHSGPPSDSTLAEYREAKQAYEVAGDAWEEAGDMHRARRMREKAHQLGSTIAYTWGTHGVRDPSRRSTKQKLVARKIRILRQEGYPEKQAVAIAMRMAGVPRKRPR